MTLAPAQGAEDNFASTAPVVMADWAEAEQLWLRTPAFNGAITLQPGLVHQANGGVLCFRYVHCWRNRAAWVRLKKLW